MVRIRLACALLVLPCLALPAAAEHARINLSVKAVDPETGMSGEEAHASADKEPPSGGLYPRPLFKARVNQLLVLEFFLTNTYPHGVLKDVTVRYFVVREEKAQQKTLPALNKDVVTQGRFTLNFKPQARVGAHVAFTVKTPGLYLLRVQTENTDSDHEHFSAIDLQVE